MKKLTNEQKIELCLKLLHADTEKEVETILRKNDLWFHDENWRLLSDTPSNWSTAGNQQAKPVPSLVEKLVNSIDTILISECLQNGIDPRSNEAPKSMTDAVEQFFKVPSGMLENLSGAERSKLGQMIHLVCTGIPNHEPCYTVIDSGEGQTPTKIHSTILSIPGQKGNPSKKGIQFVQGIFNMGGTGVIRFCGKQSLQLIITRRNPKLLPDTPNQKDLLWSFTILRRRTPTIGRASSTIEYLAPVNVSGRTENDTLTFSADSIPALPKNSDPNVKNNAEHAYSKPMTHGTCIKLYEYKIGPGLKTNVLFDLNYELNRHFFKMGLPIRLEERRLKGPRGEKYSGHSFDTTLAGMNVRLKDAKNDLIQEVFPGTINIPNIGEIDITVHVLQNFHSQRKDGKKVDNRNNYHGGAEIQVIVNGQQHGTIPRPLLSRQSVGLNHIEEKLFIILDATNISPKAKEDLFMASRDRLVDGDYKKALEDALIEHLKDNERLHELNEEEKQKSLEKAMKDTRTLEDVFTKLVKKDPVLSKFFPQFGPVIKPAGFKWKKTPGKYVGKKTPTFFRLKDGKEKFVLKAPLNKSPKLVFEHDADNDYFSRVIRPAKLKASIWDVKKRQYIQTNILLKSTSTVNGITNIRLQPLSSSKVGEQLKIKIEMIDKKFGDKTEFKGTLRFLKEIPKSLVKHCLCDCHDQGAKSCPKCKENHKQSKQKPPHTRIQEQVIGTGQGGMSLPIPIPVFENDSNWNKFGFTKSTGFKVSFDGKDFLVYVNMDNEYLKQETEGEKEPEFLTNLYKSAMAMIAFGIYHKLDSKENQRKEENKSENDTMSISDKAADASEGIAMVLLPIITKLGAEARQIQKLDV